MRSSKELKNFECVVDWRHKFLCLEREGSSIHFRNLHLRELP